MPAKENTERNTAIDYINRDIVNVKNDIQTLSKLVRDGNGQPSLMQQVATLNNELLHAKAELQNSIYELRESVMTCQHRHESRSKLAWHFKTAIVVSLITSITSIIIHFYK